jgi:hypothetical protein
VRKKAPKLWRRKKAGKFVGNWFVTVKDVPVNLGTKDAPRALERRPLALNGTRNFQDDGDAAADAVVAGVAPPPDPIPPIVPPPPDVPADTVPPPPTPESETPPEPAETLEDAVNAAADEAAGEEPDPEGVPKPAAANVEFAVSMEDVLRVLGLPAEQLAPAAVELQLQATEWIADLRGKALAPIRPTHIGRGLATAAYVPIIKALQVEDLKINPLYLLLAGTGLMLVTQIKGMRDKEPKAASAAKAA